VSEVPHVHRQHEIPVRQGGCGDVLLDAASSGRLEDEVPSMSTRTELPVSLESGDRLTREEFHRRYSACPDIKKAELVEGVVYVASPIRFDRHAQKHFLVVTWLGTYVALTPGVEPGGDNGTIFLDDGNEVQPDAFLWRPEPGGPRLTDDGYIEGAPQLIVEVSASSVSYDLHDKLEAYRRNRVREYVVWRTLDAAIDWFRLRDGAYVRIEPDADGVIESEQFPGLRLHVPSMLAGDLAAVLARLRSDA
jgi:Uma2 family endonuclease